MADNEFAAAAAAGAFALHWRAHGLAYGGRAAIVKELDEGCVVVANVSRAVVDAARARF